MSPQTPFCCRSFTTHDQGRERGRRRLRAREHGAATGLGFAWLRVLLNIMGEWEAPAILTQIIKNSIAEDITSSSSSSSAMVACGVAASAPTRISIARTCCYLQQDEWGEWSSMHYVAAQFIWPVVGVATDELGFETRPRANGRAGAIMMLTFGTLVLLVMLNLLIA